MGGSLCPGAGDHKAVQAFFSSPSHAPLLGLSTAVGRHGVPFPDLWSGLDPGWMGSGVVSPGLCVEVSRPKPRGWVHSLPSPWLAWVLPGGL